jgi:AcrR family transcriptional regulator
MAAARTRSAPHAPALREPLQARSRETLERFLAAAEALLADKTFEEISVADVARKARSSIGAFYTRFANKEALLPILYERYNRAVGETLFARSGARAAAPATLRKAVERLVATVIREYRARRGLFRAMGLYTRSHPDAIRPDQRARQESVQELYVGSVLACRDEIRHPDPARAVELALFAVSAACREKILFGSPHAASVRVSDDELAREMTRLFLAYLVHPER